MDDSPKDPKIAGLPRVWERSMRTAGRFLVLVTISGLLTNCGGGGNGKPQPVQIPDPPTAPVVTISADTKQLIFSWGAVATATHYRLLENPDWHSGFTQVGDDIPSAELSVTRGIAVHLHDWVNAVYMVQACNAGGCTDSTLVNTTEVMLDTIGYLKASNSDVGDDFGSSVALSADGATLAVGTKFEGSAATGINGDQADESAPSSGAVYLFRLDGGTWYQQAYIKASNTDSNDLFGNSVVLNADGNTLAVGANREDSAATDIDGDQADNSADRAGAVYIFRFDDQVWSQQAYVKASNTGEGDDFGSSVALSADGNTLTVGAPREKSGATGVNGDQNDNSTGRSGAVYLFRFDGTSWAQQAYVKASNTDEWSDGFGHAVALAAGGNTLAASATGEYSSATGINGDQNDNSRPYSGAVYLFRFDGSVWQQQAYIKASNTDEGDHFGESIALSTDGNTMAIGAAGEESGATGINGDQVDNLVNYAGAVYLFRFNGADWSQQAYIKASNTDKRYARFGNAVALSGDGNTMAVGANGEGSGATGINGNQGTGDFLRNGAVYLFRFDETSWAQRAYIKASNTDWDDEFGYSVALSTDGETLVVGALLEDSGAAGVNGDQADNSAPDAGAVYVY